MLRAALILLIACDAGAREELTAPPVIAPVIAKPAAPTKPPAAISIPAAIPNPVTSVLPASAIATLTGCWRYADETWTFRHQGTGLVVVREVRDPAYADRARIPHDVSYDPRSKTFGFGAAGRIHGLMMLFQIEHDTLKNTVFTSHTPGSYAWTGNSWTLKRC